MLHYRIRYEDGSEVPVTGRTELAHRLYTEIGDRLDSNDRWSGGSFKHRIWNSSDEHVSDDFKDYLDVTVEYKIKPH